MDSLKRSAKNNIWACCDRKTPPQPKDLLTEALNASDKVILLFSVSNCHGWHGYARVTSVPGSVSDQEFHASLDSSDTYFSIKDSAGKSLDWYRFKVEWNLLFLKEHGDQCLPLGATQDLVCLDGTSLNKARNFQQVSSEIGDMVCDKMEKYHQSLTKKVQTDQAEKREKIPPPFFQPGREKNPQIVWQKLVHKVEGLGRVLLACVFGSQRYAGNFNPKFQEIPPPFQFTKTGR